MAADIVFPGGLMALREEGFDDIRAVLDYAIVSEKDSILFYLELARLSSDEAARNVFLEHRRTGTRTHAQAVPPEG